MTNVILYVMSFFHIKFWLLYKLRKRKNDICLVVINETLNKTPEISFKKKTLKMKEIISIQILLDKVQNFT